ncbi:MAG: EAL domain-containing protein [Magnetococcales bacterium]|nr:EAL domain-containing protein [Magnetococcales bacterium]
MRDRSFTLSLVESSPTALFKIDLTGLIVFINPKWSEMTGLPLSEALGKPWMTTIIQAQDQQRVNEAWRNQAGNGKPFSCEFRLQNSTAQPIWALGNFSEDIDPSGTLSGYVGTLTDIDDLKRMTESLLIGQKVANLGSWDWKIEQNLISWTDETFRIFGLQPQEFPASYEAFLRYAHPADHKKIQKNISLSLSDPKHDHLVEYRVIRPNGQERIVIERGWVERDLNGRAFHMVGTLHDITDLRSMENQLKLIQIVLDQTHEGIFIADANSRIVSVNQALCKLYGYTSEEMIGQSVNLFQSSQEDSVLYKKIWQTLKEGGIWIGEAVNRRKNGEHFPVKMNLQAIFDHQGKIKNFVCFFSDLTEIKQWDKKLAFSTSHDPLTSLPNRGLFLDRLGQAVQQAKRENTRIGVAVLDIDLFKKVNDSLGNACGDDLLKMFAERIKQTVRKEDTVCRLGGDEFSIIHPNTGSAETLAQMTQRLFKVLAKPFPLAGQELHFTASVGLTIFPEDGNDPDALLKNAAQAMTRAKDVGRSNFQFFSKDLDQRANRRLSLENSMRAGLKKGEFILHHQPKVDLSTGHIAGMESLIRWENEDKSLFTPNVFIPVAEETGLIVPLGDWVLREACFKTAQWCSHSPDIRVAVNLSARQLKEKSLLNRIDSALRDSGLPPEKLELEITESMVMENVDEIINILRKIKDRGISIAMDDFGTGYSSLSILKHFPIDTLKIDRSFVQELSRDSDDAQIVSAIISMSHSLHLKVVAEGVETREQLELLSERGCDLIQGYYFSKPLPEKQFGQMLIDKKVLILHT